MFPIGLKRADLSETLASIYEKNSPWYNLGETFQNPLMRRGGLCLERIVPNVEEVSAIIQATLDGAGVLLAVLLLVLC